MSPLREFRRWLQVKTGRVDTPLDGGMPYWIVSFLFHLSVLFFLSFVLIAPNSRVPVEVKLDPIEEPAILEDLPPEIRFDDDRSEEIGSKALAGHDVAANLALEFSTEDQIEIDTSLEVRDHGEILFDMANVTAMADQIDVVPVKGTVGVAATGATGAVDRITQEIVTSLESRRTLVVWMFDRSASLLRQREQIVQHLDQVYEELSMLEAAGAEAFAKHSDIPLLSQIVAFGETYEFAFREPTDSLLQIKNAVRSIQTDTSGIENVFSAVAGAVEKYRGLRRAKAGGEPERNVLIVIISDEAGDDLDMLDAAVAACQKTQIPVYVVGVPAPFGRQETEVKWVDPDPEYDQTPQWTTVRQGPESLYPERLNLQFSGDDDASLEHIDSGFGPFGLTRLAFESGGIYFCVHPNRNQNGLKRWQTSEFSAYLTHFFDPLVMRRYRPEYVSLPAYQKQVSENQARLALVQAAQQSSVDSLEPPNLVFPKFDEAAFVNAVTFAQRAAATLEPKINRLYEILKVGEADRELEISPRWQAGFDLAYGHTLAVKVRAESYNAMLAMAKTSLRFTDEKNNTWRLVPANEVTTGSQTETLAAKAQSYLQRVVDLHPGTPWALLAQKEMASPIGWKWEESFTPPPQPPSEQPANNNNNVAPPQPEQAQMLPPPKPRRPVPKL